MRRNGTSWLDKVTGGRDGKQCRNRRRENKYGR